ncbi:MAG TPA: hypothetical protein VJS47_00500 [Rhizomicrobium sp.]|nr:hypothetical protein [Rhizomicrobium sp.]
MGVQSPKKPDWWGDDLNGLQVNLNPAQDSSAALMTLPEEPITSANLVGSTPEGISKKAADWAKSQVGNTDYQVVDRSDKIGGDWRPLLPWGLGAVAAPKCNIFVGDAFAKGGIGIDNPVANGATYPGTKEWANAEVKIPGFRVLDRNEKLQAGDVMTDGHHVGIYVPGPKGEDMTVSAAIPGRGDAVVHNRWGFRGDEGPMTTRRFVGTP